MKIILLIKLTIIRFDYSWIYERFFKEREHHYSISVKYFPVVWLHHVTSKGLPSSTQQTYVEIRASSVLWHTPPYPAFA